MLCIFIVIPLVISVLASNLYKFAYNIENQNETILSRLWRGSQINWRNDTNSNSNLYLPYGWLPSICRNVNSKRQVFASHILNKAYQITCLWKTQEQHSS